jgi:hypothetical protein
VHVLLSGIVGSTAYGLAGPDSDVDRLGIFTYDTERFFGLTDPADSHVSTKPDATLHEARKAAKLMLGCNPTASEILWLPDDLYEVRTALGDEAIAIRSAFLSAGRVRAAYLGYAEQQFTKLKSRGDGSFSADTRRRTSKHARHLARLCDQGYGLYAHGKLRIRLDNPGFYMDFGEQVASGDLDTAEALLAAVEANFDETRSALPDVPDVRTVEDWLLRVRRAYFTPEENGQPCQR